MPEKTLTSPARWWIFAAILVADVPDLLSTTATNIAAPSIVAQLRAPHSPIPWLGSSYPLALGSILVIGGHLGDKYGYRRLFLVGLIGFTAASLLCALSRDPVSIVAARIVQGAFGGVVEGGDSGWGTLPVGSIAVGRTLLAVFVAHQRRSSNPLLSPALLRFGIRRRTWKRRRRAGRQRQRLPQRSTITGQFGRIRRRVDHFPGHRHYRCAARRMNNA